MDTIDHVVTATLIPEGERLNELPRFFGSTLLQAELRVYQRMGSICPEYSGGYWEFYSLSNGGFYMAPRYEDPYAVLVDMNGYRGSMSADAAGLTACLFAFCDLANLPGLEQERFTLLFHQLRAYALGHAERSEIFSAID